MNLVPVLLLFFHLVAAAYWVGGMAAMHFAVRPAAVAVLEPPARLAFMARALGRFFVGVSVSIGTLLASGIAMILQAGGMGRLHWSVHAMVGVGLLMMAIYGHIRFGVYPKLRRAVAAGEWPVAAGRLDLVRRLVVLNLVLGVFVFAVATVGRVI